MKLKQLIEISTLDQDQFDTPTSYQVECVSIYLEEDPEVILDWTFERIKAKYDEIQLKINSRVSKGPDEIKISKISLYPVPFKVLTLGAFIDLETYCSDIKYLANACAVLFRKKLKGKNLEEDKWEEYGDFLDIRTPYLLELDLNKLMPTYYAYLEWRGMVMQKYQGLFDSYQGEDDPDTDGISRAELEKIKQEEARMKAFSWEKTILKIINGDATKFERALDIPIILALNILAAKK